LGKWLDKRIKVHVFMCVLGLLFYRYIQWKIEKETGERLPMGRMVSLLHRIRLGGLILTNKEKQKGREWRKIRFKLERLENKEERVIVKALNLERFVPN
jgi:transposase